MAADYTVPHPEADDKEAWREWWHVWNLWWKQHDLNIAGMIPEPRPISQEEAKMPPLKIFRPEGS